LKSLKGEKSLPWRVRICTFRKLFFIIYSRRLRFKQER